jgi:hypothetical protein
VGDVEVRIALGAAMVASVALLLWFGRHITFSDDELVWFSTSPRISLRAALEPYNGHLILTTHLLYAGLLNAFGSDYIIFRSLTIGAVLLTAGLFFEFARRRVGAVAALAPTLVLLFYGSDANHMITGNGFTVLLPLALGIAALMALEREDLGGDLGACLFLSFALATYSVAVGFVVGAGVLILLGRDRWRRAWVFVVPVVLYAAWFLWSRNHGDSTEGSVSIANLLLVPSWAFNALATVGAATVGLKYDYGPSGSDWGPVVAVAALGALAWRVRRGHVPKWLWSLLAIPLALWTIEAARGSFPPFHVPQSPRYIYPGTLAVLLVAVEAARGARLGRRGVVILYVGVAISLATNIALLRSESGSPRGRALTTRVELAAVDIDGGRFGPQLGDGLKGKALRVGERNGVATGYIDAVRKFGSPAYSLPELRARPEVLRQHADQILADNLGLRLQPSSEPNRRCRRIGGKPGQGTMFQLPAGGSVLSTSGGSAPLLLRRFAAAPTVKAGDISPTPAALAIPTDSAPDPWYAFTPARSVVACRPPA